MDRLIVRGGHALEGSIDIAGAKNAALPIIAASLLSEQPLELSNLPAVTDVATMLDVVEAQGVSVERKGAHGAVLHAQQATNAETHYEAVRRARATILVLAPLLARFGTARVPLPGGCAIGARPIDLHLAALEKLGATIEVDGGYIVAHAPDGLVGDRIFLSTPSVGATHMAMMAATRARGETEILNAAREPEVADVAACLVAMGAQIEGAGTHRIRIAGDTRFRSASHALIADRIEAGTYCAAAAITGGRLDLVGARFEHLAAECQVLERMGARILPSDRGLYVERSGALTATDITTESFPGFPTDLQAQFMAVMTVAEGSALIRETIFENRFMHVPELKRLGADLTQQATTVLVRGVSGLKGAPVMATDLRASVSLILAGLVADGETDISGVHHLDRGYEDLARKLTRCGANIERVRS